MKLNFLLAGLILNLFFNCNSILDLMKPGYLIFVFLLAYQITFAESKSVKAHLRPESSINIDGKLSESIWNSISYLSGFNQKTPYEGRPAHGDCKIAFLYDTHSLYIGIKVEHNDSLGILSTLTRRDEAGNSERILISLDTYNDKRTAYTFGITASGTRLDYYHSKDEEYARDYSFNPVWEAETIRNKYGWTAEIQIPFSQLRFNEKDEQTWGINVNWWFPAAKEDNYWIVIPKNESGWSSRMGKLTGLFDLPSTMKLELLPYFASNINYDKSIPDDNPFRDVIETKFRTGFDFKVGLGPNLSLDAAINPDFGQIEADPAEVNLSNFETFFPEKRPFFIEGKELFQGYGNNLFYSRRIGEAPRYGLPGDFTDIPQNTDILGALKLTGRLSQGLTIGAMNAVTSKETGSYYFSEQDSSGKKEIWPLSNFSIIRMQKELGEESSSIGIMLTNVYRDLNTSSIFLKENLSRDALTGDLDWYLRLDNSTYQLDGHIGFSHLQGTREAMTNIQTSSSHYFQRPDAAYVSVDSNKTNMTGYMGLARFKKISGEHWLYEISAGFETPHLELNDIGRMNRADKLYSNFILKYREMRPGKHFYDYNFTAKYYNEFNFGYVPLDKEMQINAAVTFLNRHSFSFNFKYNFISFDAYKTRGGPLIKEPASGKITLNYRSDWTQNNTWSIGSYYKKDGLQGEEFRISGGLNFRLINRLEFSFSPYFTYDKEAMQYIKTIGEGPSETYGQSYVFSPIERNTLAAQFRFSYGIANDLTLEFYAEPFASNGDYYDISRLKNPASYDLLKYGTGNTQISKADNGDYIISENGIDFRLDNPDFSYLSFRSNLVLRWEYLPGSVLYFVWQQNRNSYMKTPVDIDHNSLYDAISSSGENYLSLKISYWLPVNTI